MPSFKTAKERPPWPEDTEEALIRREERLRTIGATGKGKRARAVIGTKAVRRLASVAFVVFASWLLAEISNRVNLVETLVRFSE
jgi:hypothetical protein